MMDRHLQEQERLDADLIQGLRGLGDIPECQLSRERVRDAILNSDLKARPSAPAGLRWAVVPVLAVAIGWALMQHDRAPSGSNSVGKAVKSPAPMAQAESPSATNLASPEPMRMEAAPKLESEVQAASGRRPSATRRTRNRAILVARQDPPALAGETLVAQAAPVAPGPQAPMSPESEGPTSPEVAPETHSDEAPVVVIQQEPTLETGASRAKEVEANGQIVIGG